MMEASAAARDVSVASLFRELGVQRAYFRTLPGNNGDQLIELGSRHFFAGHGVRLVRSPKAADAIVINGGGAMNDIWVFGLELLERLASEHADRPLIVLPSSFYLSKARSELAAALRGRSAPTWLFCREHYSLELLQGLDLPPEVRLSTDEDMAFHLRDSRFLQGFRERGSAQRILVVERADPESSTGVARTRPPAYPQLGRLVPRAWRPVAEELALVKRRRDAQRSAAVSELPTVFARETVARVREEHPELSGAPTYYLDIARRSHCSFRRYCGLIAEAAAVITTRLHVAALGAMLEKPTYCQPGWYHKIKGVYEYSMATMAWVQLI
jgi:exopolysaccharide biosynthesis predicted pyruvyltransferase EpsI